MCLQLIQEVLICHESICGNLVSQHHCGSFVGGVGGGGEWKKEANNSAEGLTGALNQTSKAGPAVNTH